MSHRTARRAAALLAGALALASVVAAPPATAGPEGYALANSWDAAADVDVAAAPDGTVWAVDGSSTLNHFTPTGTLLGSFTLSGFSFAQAIAVGPDGTLYVTDATTGSPSVVAFSPQGTALRGYDLTDGAVALGVDVAPTGEVLITNASSDRVEVFSAGGTWLRNLGSSGAGPGQVDRPDDVVVGADGTVFVSDYSNDRVQKFALGTGAFLGGFGQPGRGAGQFDRPYAVDLTPTGNLVAFDKYALQEFTPAGVLVSRTEHGQSLLFDYQGMSLDAAGAIYTTRLKGLARFVAATPPVTQPPPVPQPPTPPGQQVGTISLAKRAVPVTGSKGKLTLSCKAAPCRGRVTLVSTARKPATLARATYSLQPGAATVKVKLTKKGRALVKKNRKVAVKVTITPSTGAKVTAKAKLVRRRG